MHNRPKIYVDNCIEKLEAAVYITKESIVKIDGNTYEVQSEKKEGKYQIMFGDDFNLPSCTCYSWKQNRLPCKHMMGVIKHDDAVTFGKLYHNSVFFNLDFEVLGINRKEPWVCI